jgi:uncharacterized iron-regulated membrane protein
VVVGGGGQGALSRQDHDVHVAGDRFTSAHHYGIFVRGAEALTSRLYKPVLVDAQTGQVTDSRPLPEYLTAMLISQPLHFGDYGGGWMQLLWALLDIATIIVLGSGLYLWFVRRKAVTVPEVKQPEPASMEAQ